MVSLGIDRIQEYSSMFQGKSLGLITNFSGVSSSLTEDLDVFESCGYHVTKLFTPEHGLYGAMDGEAIDSMTHPKYHIPMISLYGEKKGPSKEDLSGIDLLIYDIQDVGLRYYTYIYTLANCMKAAASCGVPFVVLDRPNPLGGTVDGNRMKDEFASFVGDHSLPIRYGLTPGELGFYFKEFLHLNLTYDVIPMKGYKKDMLFPDTKQLWNLPSPSIHTFQTILCYYGGCFFEATNISEGRGTAAPFQIFGAPFVKLDEFVNELRSRVDNPDVAIRPRAFTPFWSKHAGKTCFGVEFLPTSNSLDFLSTALITMKTFKDLYPNNFEFVKYADVSRLTSLSGDDTADDYLNGKISMKDLRLLWKEEATSFEKEVASLRLYQ